jgi:hypothetical protein
MSLITEAHLTKLVDLAITGSDGEKEIELLRLLLLLTQERVARSADDPSRHRWTDSSSSLMRAATDRGMKLLERSQPIVKSSGRTLQDFPESFYSMAIISGDKREDSSSRITIGDFGAVSASPAEFRWLAALRLQPDVELYSDKVVVLEDIEALRRRFGKRHLLVVGSPASNHLARRILLDPPAKGWNRAAPLFRFNISRHALPEIEQLLEPLAGLKRIQLAAKRADESTEAALRHWLRYLFMGGIIDPTYEGLWIRALALGQDRDYGLVSIARNPFSDSNDPYFCVAVAGFHLFGTAFALKMLAKPVENFAEHPYGGVIKVSIDGPTFAQRFDDSIPEWENQSGYTVEQLRSRLQRMMNEFTPTLLHTTPEELESCARLIDQLSGASKPRSVHAGDAG